MTYTDLLHELIAEQGATLDEAEAAIDARATADVVPLDGTLPTAFIDRVHADVN